MDVQLDNWSNVESFVADQFMKKLRRNQLGLNTKRPPPYVMSATLRMAASVDRKTSADRRLLRLLLVEMASTCVAQISDAERDGMVLHATRCTMAECLSVCRGLRGDEAHLFIVESGAVTAEVEGAVVTLTRGDYFGEAIETVMYSAGQLHAKERGTVFRVPADKCKALYGLWERKVAEYLPVLRRVAPFQGLPLWSLLRASQEATTWTAARNTVVVGKGQRFTGIHVVLRGSLVVRGPRLAQPQEPFLFSAGDIVGEEAAVNRHGSSTVDIKAVDPAGSALLTLPERVSLWHVVPLVRTQLNILAKAYVVEAT